MKLHSLLLLCSLAASTAVAANRVARVIYYGASEDAPETAYVHQAGTEAQEVELGRFNFSDSFELAPDTKRLFFLPDALPKDATLPEEAPALEIPSDWDKIIIIVLEDQSNPILPIQLKAINANEDVFGQGDTCFVNFSEMTVLGDVGDKDLLIKPGETIVIAKPRTGRGNFMQKLDAYKDDENRKRRVVQQRCQYDPSERILTFMVSLPPPRMIKVYSAPIIDF